MVRAARLVPNPNRDHDREIVLMDDRRAAEMQAYCNSPRGVFVPVQPTTTTPVMHTPVPLRSSHRTPALRRVFRPLRQLLVGSSLALLPLTGLAVPVNIGIGPAGGHYGNAQFDSSYINPDYTLVASPTEHVSTWSQDVRAPSPYLSAPEGGSLTNNTHIDVTITPLAGWKIQEIGLGFYMSANSSWGWFFASWTWSIYDLAGQLVNSGQVQNGSTQWQQHYTGWVGGPGQGAVAVPGSGEDGFRFVVDTYGSVGYQGHMGMTTIFSFIGEQGTPTPTLPIDGGNTPGVPDGGSPLVLLSLGLGALGLLARFHRRLPSVAAG